MQPDASNIKMTRAGLLGMAAAMLGQTIPFTTQKPLEIAYPGSRNKRKQSKPGSRVLRGYAARYSHVLSAYCAENNQAAQANGKSGFMGFRSRRKFIPEIGMSVWVK